VQEKDFETVMNFLSADGYELICLFCADGFEGRAGYTLFYAFEKRGYAGVFIFAVPLRNDMGISVAGLYPSACWYEREIKDGFGVGFAGAFDERRLFLHDPYPEEFHPLRKEFVNREISPEKPDSGMDTNTKKSTARACTKYRSGRCMQG